MGIGASGPAGWARSEPRPRHRDCWTTATGLHPGIDCRSFCWASSGLLPGSDFGAATSGLRRGVARDGAAHGLVASCGGRGSGPVHGDGAARARRGGRHAHSVLLRRGREDGRGHDEQHRSRAADGRYDLPELHRTGRQALLPPRSRRRHQRVRVGHGRTRGGSDGRLRGRRQGVSAGRRRAPLFVQDRPLRPDPQRAPRHGLGVA